MDGWRRGGSDTPGTGDKRDRRDGVARGASSPLTEEQRVKQIFDEVDALWPDTRGRAPSIEALPPELDNHEVWGDPEVRAALGLPAVGVRRRESREGPAHFDLDRPLPDGTTGREHLERFEPRRARLPEVSAEDADRYIRDQGDRRPWLRPALDSPPEVKRVYAALDQSSCHALQRHEGFGDDELQRRRVLFREDPAQLDQVKREAGLDGVIPDRYHYCGELATRIHDTDAFAMGWARALAHDDVRAILSRPHDKAFKPRWVFVPLDDALGPGGHQCCSGFRLIGRRPGEATRDRSAWEVARAAGASPGRMRPPQAERIGSFEGGFIQVRFRPTRDRSGYEVSTAFPVPRVDGPLARDRP